MRTAGADPAVVGGKAANLAKARAAGLPVPAGFGVSTDQLAAAVAGDAAAWSSIVDARRSLGEILAVRSSAVGEDGGSASFAGQYSTVLGVRTDDELRAALAEVHASAAGADAYRERLGLPPGQVAAHVQDLVVADAAGVLFTRDPLGGPGMVIEAAWGLGEAVVSGLVTPDHWQLSAGGTVRQQIIGRKHVAIRLAPGGGTHQEPVAAADAARPCLDAPMLAQVAALGRRCVDVFGADQDVEFAVAAGQLHLLQARPITTRR